MRDKANCEYAVIHDGNKQYIYTEIHQNRNTLNPAILKSAEPSV